MSDESAGRLSLGLYRAAFRALTPVVGWTLNYRASRGKEDPARLDERWGRGAHPRPAGKLVWVHGASVGECVAALPLIERLVARSNVHVLVTSNTVTSAQLMAERLPPNAFHQFVPIDRRDAVRNFLAHWKPDLALFVESELWPNLILETKAAGIKSALINARMSERSFRGWQRARGMARRVLSTFEVCLAQDVEIAERLRKLGAREVEIIGSLKADASPLPVDEEAFASFETAIGTRPIFLAASTHPGEDEIVLDIAVALKSKLPGLLTIIVPRHPHRGGDIEHLSLAHGFFVVRRSNDALPDDGIDIYIADTMGELGLFYRAAKFAFLGGSLVPHGGQNPLEAANLGKAVLTGPYTDNFKDIYDAVLGAQESGRVHSAAELQAEVLRLSLHPAAAVQLGEKGAAASAKLSGALNRTFEWTENLLLKGAHARA